ncbi:MAG: C4-dicarboxylate transporter DcuC [Negativicutes bacterium]
MLVVAGIIIVLITIYLLVKRHESRMVLFCSGLLMASLAGNPMAAFKAFSSRMVTGSLIEPICAVMGFAYVMKATKCDRQLIILVSKALRKVKPILIPGAVMATFGINIALPAASGCAAAVGAVLIPILISSGIHPAIAGAAILAGTYGSMLSPGLSHNPFIAKLGGVGVMDVIAVHARTDIIAAFIGAITLAVLARILKEDSGYVGAEFKIEGSSEKVNVIWAMVPILPVAILVIGATDLVPVFKKLAVSHAMLIGAIIAVILTRKNPSEIAKQFFDGMGWSYAQIIGIIIAAAVFVSGLEAIGLVKAFITLLITSPQIVNIAATFGPFLLGVISGSGDAAALAFNEAVTPHAPSFGHGILNMGSMAALGGALGRTASPISGACIVCASLSGANPMDIAKRNVPGMVLACIVAMLLLL